MTRVPLPGGSSGDTFSIVPQNLSDTAPTFDSASKQIYEQELIFDGLTDKVVGELLALQSLTKLAEALRNFKERASQIMNCLANEEAVVGEVLVETAFAVNGNESLIGNLFQQINPGSQPQPGTGFSLMPPILQPKGNPEPVPPWVILPELEP